MDSEERKQTAWLLPATSKNRAHLVEFQSDDEDGSWARAGWIAFYGKVEFPPREK